MKLDRARLSALSSFLLVLTTVVLAAPADAATDWSSVSATTTTNFNDVAAEGASIYAVGNGGKVFASTNGGSTWAEKASPQAGDLFAVEMAGGFCGTFTTDCVWVAGAGGTIYFSSDGAATWCAQTTNSTQTIYGLDSRGPNDIIAVGANGTILRSSLARGASNARECGAAGIYDVVPSGTTRALRDVAENPAGGQVIVGAGGTILTMATAGASANQVTSVISGTTADLYGVAGATSTGGLSSRVWAVGDGGTVVSRAGTGAFAGQASGTAVNLRDVEAVSDTDAVAVGPQGTIIAFRSGGWVAQTSGTCKALHRVGPRFVTPTRTDYLAVGDTGTVLQNTANPAGIQPSCTAPAPAPAPEPTAGGGYRMVAADGGVFAFGDRRFHGSTGGKALNKPIVGGASNPVTLAGYWLVASDGGVFAFGDAVFHGSLGGTTIASPAVEIEPTVTGKGYWIVQANGKVNPFGDARSYGDMSAKALNGSIIGMSVTPSGAGYWLVGQDGGIFSFGDAKFHGSMGNRRLNAPVIDLAPAPGGGGYHLLAKDGGVFSFGAAVFRGSTGDMKLNAPAVAMLVTPSGGYWLVASDGGVFSFGARFHGSMGATRLNAPVLDAIP